LGRRFANAKMPEAPAYSFTEEHIVPWYQVYFAVSPFISAGQLDGPAVVISAKKPQLPTALVDTIQLEECPFLICVIVEALTGTEFILKLMLYRLASPPLLDTISGGCSL
jgi:hypothetical protein